MEINERRGVKGEKVFQRSFHDHIIRNEQDYAEPLTYVYENPTRWLYDKLYVKSQP